MIGDGMATPNVPYQPAALQSLVTTLPPAQKTLTIGYDTSSSDLQVIANLVSAELRPLGLTPTVAAAHTVSAPFTLDLAGLSVG